MVVRGPNALSSEVTGLNSVGMRRKPKGVSNFGLEALSGGHLWHNMFLLTVKYKC